MPINDFSYFTSFRSIKVFNNTIAVIRKNGSTKFHIPYDLRRVKMDADDLEIELKKIGQRFLLRSHFIKSKSDFHQLFNQIINDHPPSENKVNFKASVLEMMEKLKNV